jgi:hypothetical protein
MAEFRQVARQEFPSTDPERMGKIDVMYVYMDDNMHSFTLRIPKEADNEERVKAELQAAVASAEAGGARRIEF